jgi:uncharacterized membrane protein YdbT with pleckstrin-like domain
MSEKVLYRAFPAMFRSRPILFLIFVALIIVYGLGLLLLIWWWVRHKCTTLIVSNERTTLRKGIFAKITTEVWHQDVRNVQLEQSFLQRLCGVGSIGISSSGQSGFEISVDGIPSPGRVKQLIDEHRRSMRK